MEEGRWEDGLKPQSQAGALVTLTLVGIAGYIGQLEVIDFVFKIRLMGQVRPEGALIDSEKS